MLMSIKGGTNVYWSLYSRPPDFWFLFLSLARQLKPGFWTWSRYRFSQPLGKYRKLLIHYQTLLLLYKSLKINHQFHQLRMNVRK